MLFVPLFVPLFKLAHLVGQTMVCKTDEAGTSGDVQIAVAAAVEYVETEV